MSTLSTTNLKNPSSGSNNIVLGADGTVTVGTITGTSVRGSITSGTSVASTSGVAIDFTGIPSWVKRITVMFNGVSTNGTSNYLVQIGAGSVTTSGYLSGSGRTAAGAAGYLTYTTGFGLYVAAASDACSGNMVITNISGNGWVSAHSLYTSSVGLGGGGNVTLSGTLDRVRITTVNGTDTFDAGSINILYEG